MRQQPCRRAPDGRYGEEPGPPLCAAAPGTAERRLEHLRLQDFTPQAVTYDLEQDTAIKLILMEALPLCETGSTLLTLR